MSHIERNTARVLRGLFVLRFFLFLFGAGILALRSTLMRPAQITEMHPLWGLTMLPTLLTMIYLFIPGLSSGLGQHYLPTALAATIVSFAIESLTGYLSSAAHARIILAGGREFNIAWTPGDMILLVVLACMLAGATYGRRGALHAAHLAVILHILTAIAVWLWGPSPRVFLILLPLRIAMLYLFPLFAGYMADAWREEHAALETANRQLRGYAATIEHLATSRERVRLAQAMHDTLAHTLASLVVQFEAAEALQEIDPQAAWAQIAKIKNQARLGLDEARHAIQDLRATPVEELGLAEAICQLTKRFEQKNGLSVECRVEGEPFPLLPVQANAMYRIAEEALTNVERHAEAEHLWVCLSYESGVTLTIEDDGQGFDPANVPPDRYGLVGIRERAELIEATVNLESAPTQGTRLVVQIATPWEKEPPPHGEHTINKPPMIR